MGTRTGTELSVDRVKAALEQANGSVTEAARILGCSRPTVYDWIRRHEIVRVIRP
jgi:transcriptional regulator of acetoin/glycerol metabolism